MERRRDSSHRRSDTSKAVIIVGTPGAGKSNLANNILAHPTQITFEERDGTFGGTMETQRAVWGDMIVIDTPGIPDGDPHKTVAYFDSVVEALRQEGGLNTLIVLINQDDANANPPANFGDYAVLLRQLNHLPCSKLVVCRQPATGKRSKRVEEEKRRFSARFVERTLETSGLSMPLLLLTDGQSSDSFKQVEEIVRFVRRSDRAPANLPSVRTFDELRRFWSRLADPPLRLEALKQEVEELEVSLWRRSLWMACHVVPLAYITAATPGPACLWTGPYVKREQEALAELRTEIVDKKDEIEFGVVDEEELRAAQSVLANLDYMVADGLVVAALPLY